MAGESPALWLRIARESLWGTRSILKAGGMGLPMATLLLPLPVLPSRASADTLLLFGSAVCFDLVGTLANDIADKEADRAVGKQRWIQDFPVAIGLVIVVSIAALGAIPALLSPVPARTSAAYLCAILLGTGYSLPPLRAKERGLWGPVCFALCIVLCYVMLPWAWFGGAPMAPLLVGAALFLDRWVNLHFHEIVDYARDRAQGQRTYAVLVGPVRARATLRLAVWAAIAAMLAVLGWIGFSLGAKWEAVIALMAVCGAVVYARLGKSAGELTQELPAVYLGLTFALWRILPVLLLARLALRLPGMWGITLVAVAVLLHDTLVYRRYRYR